jgi:hypothetical protein
MGIFLKMLVGQIQRLFLGGKKWLKNKLNFAIFRQ